MHAKYMDWLVSAMLCQQARHAQAHCEIRSGVSAMSRLFSTLQFAVEGTVSPEADEPTRRIVSSYAINLLTRFVSANCERWVLDIYVQNDRMRLLPTLHLGTVRPRTTIDSGAAKSVWARKKGAIRKKIAGRKPTLMAASGMGIEVYGEAALDLEAENGA